MKDKTPQGRRFADAVLFRADLGPELAHELEAKGYEGLREQFAGVNA